MTVADVAFCPYFCILMKHHRPFLIARVFMSISLLLLAGAMVWFLHKTYQDEKATLSREAGFLFINTMRNIEGDALQLLVFRGANPDSAGQGEVRWNVLQKPDSIKVTSFVQTERRTSGDKDQLKITLESREHTNRPFNEAEGSVSMFLAMSSDSMTLHAQGLNVDTTELLLKLKAGFDEALQTAELPVQYKISRQSANQVMHIHALPSGTYRDISSGDTYSAELSGYGSYLWMKMWPQILFSALLLACVLLAFGFFFKTLKMQQRLTETKNEFIQNISHELKTPIATMSVALEALREYDVLKPGQSAEYLDISRMELNRLSMLVEKVLGIVGLDRSKARLSKTAFDMDELSAEVLAAMRPRFEQAGAQVMLDKEGAAFPVEADRLHLSGVLFNLLENALKYGGDPPQITVKLHAKPGWICYTVQDNGSGIPKEYQDKIFETFFRAPSSNGHTVKGHGLGLSYAAKVVQEHGGRIFLESSGSEGSAFTVELPAHA